MVIHVRESKGGVPRDIGLSPALLDRLRVYWRWSKPKGCLFPSKMRPQQPMERKSIRLACSIAGRRAGIDKPVTPHVFRKASAYYTTFQSLFILKIIGAGQAQLAAVYGRYGLLAPGVAPQGG